MKLNVFSLTLHPNADKLTKRRNVMNIISIIKIIIFASITLLLQNRYMEYAKKTGTWEIKDWLKAELELFKQR